MTTNISEKEYAELDSRFCELVRGLHCKGICTAASCEGHAAPEKTPHPWVLIDIDNTPLERTAELTRLVAKYNVSQNSCRWAVIIFSGKDAHNRTRTSAYLEPEEKNAVRDERQLKIFQESTLRLAKFLSGGHQEHKRAG